MGDISKNFSWCEFSCGQQPVPEEYRFNVECLAKELQKVRDRLGSSIVVVSGWRTRKLNAALPGAAKNSYHLQGMAADIRAPGVPTGDLYRLIKEMVAGKDVKLGGVAWYSEPHNNFVHVDTGPRRAWRDENGLPLNG